MEKVNSKCTFGTSKKILNMSFVYIGGIIMKPVNTVYHYESNRLAN